MNTLTRKFTIILFTCFCLVSASYAQTMDTTLIKKELTKNYNAIVKGFKKNRPEIWLSYLTDSFQLKLFNGAVMDKKWTSDYVLNNARSFKIKKLKMTIEQVEIKENDVILTVKQISERTFLDEQKKKHELDVGAIQKEIWTKIENAWILKFVQEFQVLYIKRDGQ